MTSRQHKLAENNRLLYFYNEYMDTDAARNVGFFSYVVVISLAIAACAGTAVYMVLTVIFQIFIMYMYGEYPGALETNLILNPTREACGIGAACGTFMVMIISQNAKWNKLVTHFEERQYEDSRLNYSEAPGIRAEIVQERNATSRTIRYCNYRFSEAEWQRLAQRLRELNWFFGPRDEIAKVKNDHGGVLFSNITNTWSAVLRNMEKCGAIDRKGYVTPEGIDFFSQFSPTPGANKNGRPYTTSGNGRTTRDDEGGLE